MNSPAPAQTQGVIKQWGSLEGQVRALGVGRWKRGSEL